MGKKKRRVKEQVRKSLPPYRNKTTLTVYLILRALVILIMIRAFFLGEYANILLCALTLVLMLMPSVIARNLAIKLPSTLEIIVLLFIFAAEILGELNSFYVRIPNWDTMLHTINGFLCAAIGFALVDMLNREERFSIQLSPVFLALVSFCFSMTVGVLWEFFEFGADMLVGVDMQKDTVINAIGSVSLDPTMSNTVIRVEDIADVIIVHSDGTQEALGIGGYLDIGIIDTMKDLLVNFLGATVFSIIGYFYVKRKGHGNLAPKFIPQVVPREEEAPMDDPQSHTDPS